MRRLALLGFLLVVGCATRAPHQLMTPADSTSHGGDWFTSLALAALIVLVLIPTLAPKR